MLHIQHGHLPLQRISDDIRAENRILLPILHTRRIVYVVAGA